MRVALVALLVGCSFAPAAAPIDDSPPDARPDASDMGRVTDGLIALWTFDEASGATANDTSGVSPAVPLTVSMGGTPTWAGGTMTVDSPSLLISAPGDAMRLSAACAQNAGVTLEVWVVPMGATQGTAAAPATVAGIDSTVMSRSISIFQSGDQWLGRVRTNMTDPAWANGGPDLLPAAGSNVVSVLTHVVVVADANERALYVDGDQAAQTAPAGPYKWDGSYKMVFASDNNTLKRAWLGTYALVALYDRALSAAEIERNFLAGP